MLAASNDTPRYQNRVRNLRHDSRVAIHGVAPCRTTGLTCQIVYNLTRKAQGWGGGGLQCVVWLGLRPWGA